MSVTNKYNQAAEHKEMLQDMNRCHQSFCKDQLPKGLRTKTEPIIKHAPKPTISKTGHYTVKHK